MPQPTSNCPVCGEKKLKSGIANHIFGRAKAELYSYYFSQSDKKPLTDYLAQNLTVRQVKRLTLK